MQTAGDIKSAVNNIKYYTQKITELTKRQFDQDWSKGGETGINSAPGSTRFMALGAITGACNFINVCCANIETNLASAEELEKKLFAEEEDNEIEA